MNIDEHILDAGVTVREALAALNRLSGRNMTLFVVDRCGRLAGSVTDGDVRRALIAGASLDDSVARAYRPECMRVYTGEPRYQRVAEARRRGIALLPLVDADGRIVDLIDLQTISASLPIDAVLMAGGRGERLRPLTLTTPKPLLPVGGKPIIDHNVDNLMECGVDNIYVTVNYLREQIIDHFRKPEYEGKVTCVEEPERLGTMGSLSLCEGLCHDTVLVMNSDLLTNMSFERMWLQHVESGAELTMAVVPYAVSVPFAIIESEGRRITGLSEKPTYNYFANAGVYMMKRALAESVPRGVYLDAPELIARLIAEGALVEYYPIDGRWMDIGSPRDYEAAVSGL